MTEVSIDVVPDRCSVEFVSGGPIVSVFARNIDTDVTGPLVNIADRDSVTWAELDPDHTVAPAWGGTFTGLTGEQRRILENLGTSLDGEMWDEP